MTKKVIEHIPIITALVIIIGIIKLTLFYQNFDVPIKYFIGFSEIATSIAGDLLFFLLIYVVLKAIELVIKDIKPNLILFSSKSKPNLFYSVLLVVINIGLLVWGFFEETYYNKIVNSALVYFFLFLTIIQTKWANEFIAKNHELSFIIFFFLLTTLNVVIMTSTEIKSVVNGRYKGTRIVTNDTTYISSDTSYYIGQTEKYLFIYNSSKHCTVLPVSSLKEVDIYVDKNR